jgi:2-methylcitrate dehydratase
MQTRVGTLSMWKAAAAAYAARAGVFAAISAAGGMSGPPAALNGSHGLFKQVTGAPEDGAFDTPVDSFHLLDTHLKAYSSQYFTQTAISAALTLRPRIALDQIRKVVVSTFEFGRVAAADSPDKWRPRTRETADHSMPFCVAIALLDGAVTVSSFDAHNLDRPDLVALLGRIEVVEDPVFTAIYPKKVPTGIRVELADGRVETLVVDYPLGHSGNPMSLEQIAEKFLDVSGATGDMQSLLKALGGIEWLDGPAAAALIRRAVSA